MKKFFLLSTAFILTGIISFAQVPLKQLTNMPQAFLPKNSFTLPSESRPGQINAPRTVIWSDDFSADSTWTISNEVGNSDDWVITPDGPSGPFKIPNIKSTSGGNHGLFDSDVLCSGNQIADITTAAPIDLSEFAAVKLQFEQYYRRYYDSTFIFVSADSINWTKYVVNERVPVNGYNENNSAANPDNVSINISKAAAGQPKVWIRFQYYSPSSLQPGASGCDYAWMIDDVQIVDAPANDLAIGSVYYGEYSKYPVSQIQPVSFGGFVSNEGAKEQTNAVLTVNINDTLFTSSSDPATLPLYETDSFAIFDAFTPPGVDSFIVNFSVAQDSVDAVPDNNIVTARFDVTQHTYSRDNDNYSGSALYLGVGSPFTAGNLYYIQNPTTATSVSVVLGNGLDIGPVIQGKLYQIDDAGNFNEIGSSDFYTYTADDQPTVTGPNPPSVSLKFPDPISLDVGYYVAGVDAQPGAGQTVAIAVGSDILQPIQTSFLYDYSQSSWFYVTDTWMTRLNLEEPVGIANLPSDRINVYPNPASDKVMVDLGSIHSKSITMRVMNIDGQVVMNKLSQATSKTQVMNVSKLSPGMYIMQIISDEGIVTKKISVAR